MKTMGKLASILLQIASSFCFLAFAAIMIYILTSEIIGEPAGFSASASTSILPSLRLHCLQTFANIVIAQLSKDLMATSSVEGPLLSPSLVVPKSLTTLLLEFSATAQILHPFCCYFDFYHYSSKYY